jgi:hypothetical protein
MLDRLAEFSISGRHVGRLVDLIGREMEAARDQRTEDYVHHRRTTPPEPPPAAVAVGVDGGRLMTRQAQTGQGPGVFGKGWKEDKVACLHVLDGPTFDSDPHPQPPRCFREPTHVAELVRDFQARHGEGPVPETPVNDTGVSTPLTSDNGMSVPEADPPAAAAAWPPERQQRTCVATMHDSATFAKLVAAEAFGRQFFAAGRRAFLGDGQHYNWTIQEKWFADFVPIADFIHPLSNVYLSAAVVAPTATERWALYVTWMTACWQGRVADVIAALRERREQLGPVAAGETPPANDPRLVLERTVTYLTNNAARMDYPAYRCQGLPVTTATVESLIKEFNYRVKGTEKFWNQPAGAEAILQARAAVLSDDGRLERHVKDRPGSPYRYARRSGERKAG